MSYKYFDMDGFLGWVEFGVLPQVRKHAPSHIRRLLEDDEVNYSDIKDSIELYTKNAIQEEVSKYLQDNQCEFILVDAGDSYFKIDEKNAWDVLQKIYGNLLEEVWLI